MAVAVLVGAAVFHLVKHMARGRRVRRAARAHQAERTAPRLRFRKPRR